MVRSENQYFKKEINNLTSTLSNLNIKLNDVNQKVSRIHQNIEKPNAISFLQKTNYKPEDKGIERMIQSSFGNFFEEYATQFYSKINKITSNILIIKFVIKR